MPLFSNGIILTQHKEPALSSPIVRFVNPASDALEIKTKLAVSSEQEAIVEIARIARVVDERDGTPLYEMLRAAMGKAEKVVADAIDDEPYVSSRLGPLLHLSEEAANGLDLCCRALGIQNKGIMVYKTITDKETRIPRTLQKIKVTRIRGKYPTMSGAHLSRHGSDKNLVIGAGALIHFARAAYKRKVQTTTFVTAAGNCVTKPMNMEVSLDMTIMQVLERCGLSEQPTHIVCGGAMTGISVIDADNTLVTHKTRAILAFRESEKDQNYSCIGCGRCEQVCPSGLNPMYIRRLMSVKRYDLLDAFDAHLCIGCGTCGYVCPSKLHVAESVGKAKEYARAARGEGTGNEA